MPHSPVLLSEALDSLGLRPDAVVLDGTLGSGGHARAILERLGPHGRLIGIDRDPQALDRCHEILDTFPNALFRRADFRYIPELLDSLHVAGLDAVLLDVGMSSEQLEDASRGFSFARTGPLDMRMDPDNPLRAWEIVNRWPEYAIERVFRDYGEERWARRMAKAVVHARNKESISTTTELAKILEHAVPYQPARFGRTHGPRRLHSATRVFQALRIAVNDELRALDDALEGLWPRLKPGGRVAVISFHSLEDRVVKSRFRTWCHAGEGRAVNKKPIRPTVSEIQDNPRARSAKLRAVEKRL